MMNAKITKREVQRAIEDQDKADTSAPAPAPADERAAFESLKGAWQSMPPFDVFCAGWQAGRAASANETGAEGAAAAWMSTDDPRDCISDAKKRDMIEHAGAPGARLAEKYSIALGVITSAQAADSPIVDDALRYRTLINMLDRHEAVVVIAGVSNVGSAMLDAMLDRFMEPKR